MSEDGRKLVKGLSPTKRRDVAMERELLPLVNPPPPDMIPFFAHGHGFNIATS